MDENPETQLDPGGQAVLSMAFNELYPSQCYLGDLNLAFMDNVIADKMVETLVQHLLNLAVDLRIGRKDDRITVPFCTYPRDSIVAEQLLSSFGFLSDPKGPFVDLSYLSRYVAIKSIATLDEEPMLIYSGCSAFPVKEGYHCVVPSTTMMDVSDFDATVRIVGYKKFDYERHSEAINVETYDTSTLVIDCFRDTTYRSVLDVIGEANANREESWRFDTYLLIPHSSELLADVIRFKMNPMCDVIINGTLPGVGLNYRVLHNDVFFYNPETHNSFYIPVDDYLKLLTVTNQRVPFDGMSYLSFEVHQRTPGMEIRKVQSFDALLADETTLFEDIKLDINSAERMVMVSAIVIGEDTRPTQEYCYVPEALFDQCISAAQTGDLTLQNVQQIVMSRSETITTSLGRIVQKTSLTDLQFVALCQTVYLTVFDIMYYATQVLGQNKAVRGGFSSSFENLPKAIVRMAAISMILPITYFIPAPVLLVSSKILTATIFSGIVSIGTIASVVQAIAGLFQKIDGWAGYVGDFVRDPKVVFSGIFRNLVVAEDYYPFVDSIECFDYDGVKEIQLVQTYTANDMVFVQSKSGDYFDAHGNHYDLLGIPRNVRDIRTVLFSRTKATLKHSLGVLRCSEPFSDTYLSGYVSHDSLYYDRRIIAPTVVAADVPEQIADARLFDLVSESVMHVKLQRDVTDKPPDIIPLGVCALVPSIPIPQPELGRVRSLIAAKIQSSHYYDPGGILITQEDPGVLFPAITFSKVHDDQYYSSSLVLTTDQGYVREEQRTSGRDMVPLLMDIAIAERSFMAALAVTKIVDLVRRIDVVDPYPDLEFYLQRSQRREMFRLPVLTFDGMETRPGLMDWSLHVPAILNNPENDWLLFQLQMELYDSNSDEDSISDRFETVDD